MRLACIHMCNYQVLCGVSTGEEKKPEAVLEITQIHIDN